MPYYVTPTGRIALNDKQLRLLRKTSSTAEGVTAVSPKEALTARALDDKGLGKYTKDFEGCSFSINTLGQEVCKAIR